MNWLPITDAPRDVYLLVRQRNCVPGVAKFSTKLQRWIESWMEAANEDDAFVDDIAEQISVSPGYHPTQWQHLPPYEELETHESVIVGTVDHLGRRAEIQRWGMTATVSLNGASSHRETMRVSTRRRLAAGRASIRKKQRRSMRPRISEKDR